MAFWAWSLRAPSGGRSFEAGTKAAVSSPRRAFFVALVENAPSWSGGPRPTPGHRLRGVLPRLAARSSSRAAVLGGGARRRAGAAGRCRPPPPRRRPWQYCNARRPSPGPARRPRHVRLRPSSRRTRVRHLLPRLASAPLAHGIEARCVPRTGASTARAAQGADAAHDVVDALEFRSL